MILFSPNDQTVAFISLCVTILLPVLVGLVTKASTSGGFKAILLAALSAVTGIGSVLIATDGPVDLYPLFLASVGTFVIAVATYYGLWKPTTVTAKAQSALISD